MSAPETTVLPTGLRLGELDPPPWLSEVLTPAQRVGTAEKKPMALRQQWERVVLLTPLRTAQKALLLAVSNRVMPPAFSTRTAAVTLARDAGLGESTVRAQRFELEALGWIRTEQPSRRDAKVVTLCWPLVKPDGIRSETASSERPDGVETASSERSGEVRPLAPGSETASSEHESAPRPLAPGPKEVTDEEVVGEDTLEDLFVACLSDRGKRLRKEAKAKVSHLLKAHEGDEDHIRQLLQLVPAGSRSLPSLVVQAVKVVDLVQDRLHRLERGSYGDISYVREDVREAFRSPDDQALGDQLITDWERSRAVAA